MNRDFEFIPDDAGFQAVLHGTEVRTMLNRVGDAAVAAAVAAAPYDSSRKEGEHYRDQFYADIVHHEKLNRPVVEFGNSSDLALIIEYGTKKTPAHRTIRRGLEGAKKALKS